MDPVCHAFPNASSTFFQNNCKLVANNWQWLIHRLLAMYKIKIVVNNNNNNCNYDNLSGLLTV